MPDDHRNSSERQPALVPRRLHVLTVCTAVLIGALPGITPAQDATEEPDLDTLRTQVEDLTRLAVRTQSHVMVDVEYHFSNLWFAAHDGQWDLASFYLRETDSHLAWTVRMRPVRSLRGGGTVDLQPFRDSIKAAGFEQIAAALESKDVAAFETAYRQTLTQCHACHLASGLPYLEPRVPERQLSPLMIHSQ